MHSGTCASGFEAKPVTKPLGAKLTKPGDPSLFSIRGQPPRALPLPGQVTGEMKVQTSAPAGISDVILDFV
jgi:hypothetical protein